MFDRFISLISEFAERLSPVAVIKDYEEAVVLRLGVYNRTLKPGLHGIIPLAEEVLRDETVFRTTNLNEQSLTTIDGVSVTVSAVVGTKIRNIRKALLETRTVDEVITDTVYGTIGTLVPQHTWNQINGAEFLSFVKGTCQQTLRDYGVTVHSIAFDNLTKTTAYRLFGVNIMTRGAGRE